MTNQKLARILNVTATSLIVLNIIVFAIFGFSKRNKNMQFKAYEYYNLGMKAFKVNDFETAVYYFNNVAKNYKWSYVSEASQLKVADIYLISLRDIDKALDAYKDYVKNFPTGKNIDVVKKRIDFIETFRKDGKALLTFLKGHFLLTNGDYRSAMYYFKRVVNLYTKSEIAWRAAYEYTELKKKFPAIAKEIEKY